MGNILQIRLTCLTPDPGAARKRWPRLCELAWTLHRRNGILDGGQGLFLPRWEEGQPMPGVRELAQTLGEIARIFPDSLAPLPDDILEHLSQTADRLGEALGRWRTADAAEALDDVVNVLDSLEAILAGAPLTATPGPPPALVEARAVTWNPALLEKTCPHLCEALREADGKRHPDAAPPPADTLRLLDFVKEAPYPPEIRDRLKAPLARAAACRAALENALRHCDPRAADRHSNDMDDILEELEEAASPRPAKSKGLLRRFFG